MQNRVMQVVAQKTAVHKFDNKVEVELIELNQTKSGSKINKYIVNQLDVRLKLITIPP